MRIFLTALFLTITGFIFAQGSTVEITNFHYSAEGDRKICAGRLRMETIFESGTNDTIINVFVNQDNKTANRRFDREIRYYPNRKIKQIKFYMEVTSARGAGGCEGNRHMEEETIYIDMDTDACESDAHFFEESSDKLKHSVRFDYKITNQIEVLRNGASDEMGFSDDLVVNASPNYSGSSYSWQYQVASSLTTVKKDGWVDIETPNEPTTLIFKAEEFLDESDIGQKVVFRIQSCFGHQSGTNIDYLLLPSAPHFTRIFDTEDVSCFGQNDGTVTFELDRTLKTGESLGFSIVDLSTQIGTDHYNNPAFLVKKSREITSADMDGSFLTIAGLDPSNPERYRAEFVGGRELFAGHSSHTIKFDIDEPSTVDFSVTDSTKVNCHGGNDGTLTIRAQGGHTNGIYRYQLFKKDSQDIYKEERPWTDFTNGNIHVIENLTQGEYQVKVMNKNGDNECIAKELAPDEDGNDKPTEEDIIRTATIGQPSRPIDIKLLEVDPDRDENSFDASAHGFTDGRIVAVITGGTGPYTLNWQKNGLSQTYTTENVITGTNDDGTYTHQAILRNIGKGDYTLSVKDANFDPTFAANNKQTCTAMDIITINEPEPLELTLEETNPISCNTENAPIQTNHDKSSDGQLTARARGGIPFESTTIENNGMPYIYTWKHEVNGEFVPVPGLEKNDSILRNINHGLYSVNITDANGIVIGEYVNNELVNPTDVPYDLEQPDPIEIVFETGDIACHGGEEGWAVATVMGGSGNYTLQWSNGETTDRIENLREGKYFLSVTDENSCHTSATVEIMAPDAMDIEVLREKNPTCNDGTDGNITILVSGGAGSYTYSWSGEALGNLSSTGNENVEGLIAGTYSVTVTDANGCSLTQEFLLENPPPNLIELGDDRLLCGGQSVFIDASFPDDGTTYTWTSDNGFISSDPIIEVSEAGTYTVTLHTPLGCTGGDSITITTSEAEIDAHFVVSTQAFAGEEVALINISSPLGELVEWYFPPEAEVIVETDEDVVLVFEEPGAYDIILRSTQGECYLDFMKSIIVEEAEDIADIGDAQNPFISEFIVSPNPSDGNFKVDIELAENSEISLKMFSMATQGLLNHREEPPATEFSLDYGVALASGSYILLLETAKGSEIRKVLIK